MMGIMDDENQDEIPEKMKERKEKRKRYRRERIVMKDLARSGGKVNSWKHTQKLLEKWVENNWRTESIEFEGTVVRVQASKKFIAAKGSEQAADRVLDNVLEQKVEEEHEFVKEVLDKYGIVGESSLDKVKNKIKSIQKKLKKVDPRQR